MTSQHSPISPHGPRRGLVVQVVAYLVGLALIVPDEIARAREMAASDAGLLGWFFGMGLDETLFFVLLLLGPPLWFWRSVKSADEAPSGKTRSDVSIWERWFGSATKPVGPNAPRADRHAWTLAFIVVLVSIGVSRSIANERVGGELNLRFGDLPPAYHDEYSYLFQAKTFLAGRWSYPSHASMPQLFDQMHVVNEGRFASRYFPGAGAWLAPFVAIGHPYWGQWLAGAITVMFIFWAGRELGGNGVGFLAGLLTAASPGIGLFSNLLLAHHPTLLGLSLFIYMFLRLQRTGRVADAFFCGCGLSFAMLCRPMTAAAIGFPFGIWQLWHLLRGIPANDIAAASFRARLRLSIALGAPLLAGFAILMIQNRAITGSFTMSPYQLYTDTYTPRHVYGFNNVARGETKLGPKVIDNYDRWAENLTPSLALRNTKDRLIAATHWTFSIPMVAMGAVAFLLLLPGHDRRWWLIFAAVVSLFAAHIPYWFVGIMNWHYVFESAPLWLLMFAGATQWLMRDWQTSGRMGMPIWWGACILLTVMISLTANDGTHLKAAVNEVAFSRIKYEQLDRMIDQSINPKPALLLIEADPADRSIDYITNDPDLNGDVLRGRFRPGETNAAEVVRTFPDRSCWLYRVKANSMTRLSSPTH